MDALAAEGALFESFWAPCIPTHPGFTSIFTGTHGITHGIVSQGRRGVSLPGGMPTLPELLRGAGVVTAAIDNLAGGQPWFFRGYDHYMTLRENTMDWIAGAALKWVHAYGDSPFFLFLHPWDPHSPYVVPDAYRNRFIEGDGKSGDPERWKAVEEQLVYPFFKSFHYDRLGGVNDLDYIEAQYDSEIRYCDDGMAKLFAGLRDQGLWDDTAILITSDHGESMTEHHVYFEHHGIYDGVLHVPLIARIPHAPEGLRIRGMRQHIDLAPTVMDLFGESIPEPFEGGSLMPHLLDETDEGYDAIYAAEASRMSKWAIHTGDWKFLKNIDPGQYHIDYDELYHIAEDPHESRNLIADHPEIAENLERRLIRWKEAQLGNRPDPVRLETYQGTPMQGTLDRGLQHFNTTYEAWLRNYKERFGPGPES